MNHEISHEHLIGFVADLQKRGKKPATIESYSCDVKNFLNFLLEEGVDTFEKIDQITLANFQEQLSTKYRKHGNSVRRVVVGVRQFFKYLKDSGIKEAETPFEVMSIPCRIESIPKVLDEKEMKKLSLIASKEKPYIKASRDTAILWLLGYEGLKANEITALKWSDLLLEKDVGSLKISGSKSRVIMFSNETGRKLLEYKNAFNKEKKEAHFIHQMKSTEKRMFMGFKGRENLRPLSRLTRHGLKFLLYELGNKACINQLNSEILRHFAISNFVNQGVSIEKIMEHLGLRRKGNISKHINRLRIRKDVGN